MADLRRETYFVDNGAGWKLALHRHRLDETRPAADRWPVLIVPGYAMNSFIFGYHPNGPSIVEFLSARGFEVWTVDLRGQGAAVRVGGQRRYGLADLAVNDLAHVIDGVLDRTEVRDDAVDAIGCSLGGTYIFMQAAWQPGARIGRLVNVGGPVRWNERPLPLAALSRLPAPVVGALPIVGTRALAARALPWAARVPALLHAYLHPEIVRMDRASMLVSTVEDPHPRINSEIVLWVRRRDLIDADRHLTRDLAHVTQPLLTIVARADGIVPQATVLSGHELVGSARREVIFAGDEGCPMAHADLFISDPAPDLVFTPLANWLSKG